MKRALLNWLCCPECAGDLSVAESQVGEHSEIESGLLRCSGCSATYVIKDYIPRFVPADNYASNFGFQWNRFQRTQLDSYNGTNISRDRFLQATRWDSQRLTGAAVLDGGCGAGRFAEIALSLGAYVFAIDYSAAVDACWRNLGSHPNLHIIQADIYALPFKPRGFDFVYSLGVLQHTPDPHRACLDLAAQVQPRGWLTVDFYLRRWLSLLHPRYLMRPVTTRLDSSTVFNMVERSVPFLLPLSQIAGKFPVVGPLLKRFVPVANYDGIYPLNQKQLQEWAVLDTFDWLAPTYDQPQTPQALCAWLNEAGLEQVEIYMAAHLVGQGRRPCDLASA